MEFEGLTDSQVAERISNKEINSVEPVVSRTYFDIVTRNVLTIFNLILFSLGAVLLYFHEIPSALAAVGMITINIVIATIQEIRAKRRLDKIALLMRPKVAVIRNGIEEEIDQSMIVKDDVIHLRSGDQALVDGVLLKVRSIEMDESLLTGESRTVRKKADDMIYSGSHCVTGEGYYQVTVFGDRTFAAKMLASAKKFDNKLSLLQMETGAVTKFMMAIALVYLAVMILWNVLTTHSIVDINSAESAKMAEVILDMVPIGLFPMLVIAYMIAAVRMSDSGVLLQRANATESISHVDTVCMDKTGTITTNRLVFNSITPVTDLALAEHYATVFASATGSRNKTIDAIANRYGKTETELVDEIMFSPERKYSGVRVIEGDDEVMLIMGAFNVLSRNMTDTKGIENAVKEYSSRGLRAVVLATGAGGGFYDGDVPILPDLEPVAVIAIEDEVRPDCRDTMNKFIDNGMEIRILSGDDPEAVNSLFMIAGLPGERKILSGDELDKLSDPARKERILETNIFGRMKPDQKQMVIKTLKDSGRYVAMVGDGVNDVRSLKEANVGVALQSGSGAARGVADMVLMSDDFSALPKAMIEGNRTVSGMRDILKMYLSRNFVICLLVFLTIILFHAPPLVPITATFYAIIGLSIGSFFMVVWAKPSKVEGSILPEVLRFAIPTAILITIFGMLLYSFFHIGMSHHLFDGIFRVDLTSGDLALFGFNNATEDAIPEIVARNSLLLFLVVVAIAQMTVVVPRFRFFSVDGRIAKDIKPTILAFLLFGLLALAYWGVFNYPVFSEFVDIPPLPWPIYAVTIGVAVAWFFVTRWVLRNGILEKATNFTEWLYSLRLKSIRKKKDQ
ncbi:MAG: HAD-IC family P-type ATPase [Methanomassiliicoccaceae archaeon]|jgi:cation-transporting ATPase E|nr:HAD-IC family P-type ATPase [Methanomassiliicoccaceae archaeon]